MTRPAAARRRASRFPRPVYPHPSHAIRHTAHPPTAATLAARKAFGFRSYYKLAKDSGLNIATISMVFRGKRGLGLEGALGLSRALGMDVGTFLGKFQKFLAENGKDGKRGK